MTMCGDGYVPDGDNYSGVVMMMMVVVLVVYILYFILF